MLNSADKIIKHKTGRQPALLSAQAGKTLEAEKDNQLVNVRSKRRLQLSDVLQIQIEVWWYASGLTGVDLFWRPVPWHEVFELGHFIVCDAGEDPAQPSFEIDLVHATGLDGPSRDHALHDPAGQWMAAASPPPFDSMNR